MAATITDAVGGVVVLSMTSEETLNLNFRNKRYYWDCFVAGVGSPKIDSNISIENMGLLFKDYNSRAIYAKDNGLLQTLILNSNLDGGFVVTSINSTNCSVRPILIGQDKAFIVAQDGLLTIFNINNNNNMIEITGNGQLSLFPTNSVFGFGLGNNIYGQSGTVTVTYGNTFPGTSTETFTLGNFTGTLIINPAIRNFSTRDLMDLNSQLGTEGKILTTTYGNQNAQFYEFSYYTGMMLPVLVYADYNIDISTIANGVVIDGVTLGTGLRIYLGNQTLPEQNGVYIVGQNPGETIRDLQFMVGSFCFVILGDTYKGKWIKNTNAHPFIINSTPVTQIITSLTGLTTTSIKTANYTAKSNELIPVDSNSGIFDITLPGNPINGDIVEVVDVDGSVNTNNVTILRNGNNINGVASDYIFSTNYGRLKFQFFTGKGWICN